MDQTQIIRGNDVLYQDAVDLLGIPLNNAFYMIKVNLIHGFDVVYSFAMATFGILLVLDLALFGIYVAMGKQNDLGSMVEKTLFIGLMVYVMQHFRYLSSLLVQTMQFVGLSVGGLRREIVLADLIADPKLAPTWVTNPGEILDLGWYMVIDPYISILESMIADANIWSMLTKGFMAWQLMGPFLVVLILSFIIFTIIAIQYVMALIEFEIVMVFGVALFPFQVFKPLAFIGDKVWISIMSSAVKLGMVVLATSLSIKLVGEWGHSTRYLVDQLPASMDSWRELGAVIEFNFL
jgi:type IV secretory pathway TrbL component